MIHSGENPAPTEPGRRERRKAETRSRLLAAARKLFASGGYDATRPQDIAREADLAAGTFYLHFSDKRAAFLAFTEQAAEELMGQMADRIGDAHGFEDRLRRSIAAMFAFARDNPGVLAAAFADSAAIAAEMPSGSSLRERLVTSLERSLRYDIEQGGVSSDYDPYIIAHGIVGMIDAACVHGGSRAKSPDVLAENLTRFCSRALDPQTRPR